MMLTSTSFYIIHNSLVSVCRDLRSSEEKLRNIAAHEITGISERRIRSELGFSSADIINKLFAAMGYAGISTDRSFFGSYDRMNKLLISSI